MFVSFFPRPKWFFWSVLLWSALAVGLWYAGGRAFGAHLGLPPAAPNAEPIIGVAMFYSTPFLWFYIYYGLVVGIFAAAWQRIAPHPWWRWSILGSALILFDTYIQVEVSVGINNWRGPFYDLIQQALGGTHIDPWKLYGGVATFLSLALIFVVVGTLNYFFTQHYVFRWRTAMNAYYMAHWPKLRSIEGAAQRVQEDTMRFSQTTEDMGSSLINSLISLIAFLPILAGLSKHVKIVPIVGALPYSLVIVALLWSVLGTLLLAAVGVKLPGLYFRNQRAEAAFRKELVYGEDEAGRAQPATVAELFSRVKNNYFRLYFHYLYFNVARYVYLQVDEIVSIAVMIPSILAGAMTLGLFQQVRSAFAEVTSDFQYLVQSWPTLVELQSIYKRLRAFEATIHDRALAPIEAEAHA